MLFSLDVFYEIPPFQRDYAWDLDDVDKLLTDFSTSYRLRPDQPYLLGQTILCIKDESLRLMVIDGQQRLTTLFLFMNAATLELDRRADRTLYHDQNLVAFKACLEQRVRDDPAFVPRLLGAKGARDVLAKILSGSDVRTDAGGNQSETNILDAYLWIQEYLSSNYVSTEELFNFVDYVFRKAYVLELKLFDEKEAIRVFAVINHRGKPLNDADLIKNHLFQRIDDDAKFEEISKKWEEATNTLFDARLKRMKSMDFLLKAMIGIRTGESIARDDIFERWEPLLDNPDEAWDFAQELPKDAEILDNLSHAKSPKGKELDEVFGSHTFNWTQHFEVLMAGKKLTPTSYKELARIVDARVMLSQFASEKNQDFERVVHKWAKAVSHLDSGASRQDILQASKVVLDPQDVVLNVKKLRDQIGLLDYTVGSHRRKIRYILARCEDNVQTYHCKRKHSSLKDMMKTLDIVTGWHLDHVFPKSETGNFPMTEVPNQTSKQRVVNSLGNLVLLAPKENLSLGKTLPNENIKMEKLAASLVWLNPVLVDSTLWPNTITTSPEIRDALLSIQSQNLVQGQSGSALLDEPWGPDAVAARFNCYFKLFVEDILRDLEIDFNSLALS
jgi:hypothetical protein